MDEVIAAGNKVVGHWTGRGTHTGEWRDARGIVAPTGSPIVWRGMDILTIRDGKIAELRDIESMLSLMLQIGAVTANYSSASSA